MPVTLPNFASLASLAVAARPKRKAVKKAEKPDTLCSRSKYWIEHWLGKSTKGMTCKEAIFLAKVYYDADKKYGYNPPKI